ncbi:MAG: PaaI family thioesterase, partial [Saprospiraceae bacterium]
MSLKKKWRRKFQFINWYPPFLFSGISLKEVDEEITTIVVQMKLRWYNRNMVGTHFGGSLYSMCDPHFMFIVMMNLGGDYIVWDKSAKINFRKPGTGTVTAKFHISLEELERIKKEIDEIGKNTYWFKAEVLGGNGEVVAEVDKEIYVRK